MALIVVTGLPRSGTSLMMRMLEAGGIECVYEDVEKLRPLKQFNPNGFYESSKAMNADWSELDSWDGKAVKMITSITQLPTDIDVRVIIMRRKMDAILSSIDKVAKFKKEEPHSPHFYQGNLESIRLWCASKPHIEVWYEDILRNTPNECLRVLKLLYPNHDVNIPPPLDLAAMAKVVDKG